MHIADSTAADTPAAKIHARGCAYLSDAELLSVFLTGAARVERARVILTDAPLRDTLERLPASLRPTERVALSAALELAQRYLAADLQRGACLTDPQAAGRYCAQRLRHYPHEVFACMFLDNRHRVIAFDEVFNGTVDGAEVYPREIAKRALRYNAAAVICAHNHPSGNPEPSAADRAVTARLKQALALIDVRLLDHFVIADGPPVSMAARGWV